VTSPVNDAAATSALASYRTFAEGLPQGGRIERHVHEQDQLAVWRRHSRLLTSLTLLAEGKSIATAAHAVGYDSTAAFGTAFKQCFGVTPKAYASGKPAKT